MWDEVMVFIFMSLSLATMLIGIYAMGRTDTQKEKHNFINTICDILFKISDE